MAMDHRSCPFAGKRPGRRPMGGRPRTLTTGFDGHAGVYIVDIILSYKMIRGSSLELSRRPPLARERAVPRRLLLEAWTPLQELVGAEGSLVAHRAAAEHPESEVHVGDAPRARDLDLAKDVGDTDRPARVSGVVEEVRGAPGARGLVADGEPDQAG